ncbi:hypothetical protein EH31_09035 [Erythrobacter longus]|uniref:Short-chain dehydrogenase n=1 Tax=Erythrobacter longus TaxID=1044 RepID=A0A074MED0_ERYLO|nr:hypothetical protein EH31_09035 [Erythrobacter longus]
METVLISGANRGLGLALAQKFAEAGWKVIAGCRNPAQATALTALQEGHDIQICKLDVTNPDDIAALAQQLGDEPLDVLINNAGILDANRNDLSSIDYDEWQAIFATNSMAPVRMSLALKDNLKRSPNPRIVTVSSEMGSLNQNLEGAIAYRTSKAAVNKAMQVLATNFASDGITVVPIHPGWVRTDMGGPQAAISPKESAEGIFLLASGLNNEMSGRFWTWAGTEHPW